MKFKVFVVLGLVAMTAALAAQTKPAPREYTPPKTPWGDPDLRGTYTSDNSIGVPFERPQQFGARATLTDQEFEARDKTNAEQVAKDNNERPESKFEEDEAANNAPRDRKSTRLNSSHSGESRMPSSA